MEESEKKPEQTVDPATQKKFQNLFNKGFSAFERGNLEIAIDLLYQCLEIEPASFRVRKFLRSASLQLFSKSKPSSMKLKMAELGALPLYMKTSLLHSSGKINEALLSSEKMIEQAPLCSKYVILASECAFAAEEEETAVMLLETAFQVDMKDDAIMHALADFYCKTKQWSKAREIFAALVRLHPQDGVLIAQLKDTEARMTMAGSWEEVAKSDEKEGFRKLIKDKDTAAKLDMQAKAVVAGDDAEAIIAEQKAKIDRDPKNLNYYRALARVYQQQKRYDEAVKTLEAARKINSADPELDRLLSTVRIQSYDAHIESLRDEGKTAEATALQSERNQFVFDDLVQRVERYPNDLRLRYELGLQYLQYKSYDDAIQQFQLSQRSPKERSASLHGLASCFRAKGQRDMAIMQLETALEQLPVMDDMRKAVVFDLGELAEESGDIERAFKLYKEVYGADIAYRDIDKKMERIYTMRKKKASEKKANA